MIGGEEDEEERESIKLNRRGNPLTPSQNQLYNLYHLSVLFYSPLEAQLALSNIKSLKNWGIISAFSSLTCCLPVVFTFYSFAFVCRSINGQSPPLNQ